MQHVKLSFLTLQIWNINLDENADAEMRDFGDLQGSADWNGVGILPAKPEAL